jgi:hypothetical protein
MLSAAMVFEPILAGDPILRTPLAAMPGRIIAKSLKFS